MLSVYKFLYNYNGTFNLWGNKWWEKNLWAASSRKQGTVSEGQTINTQGRYYFDTYYKWRCVLKGNKHMWVGEDRTTHSSRVSSRVWPARTAEAQAREAPAWAPHPPHARALPSALSVTALQVGQAADIAFSCASSSYAEKLWHYASPTVAWSLLFLVV